MDEKQQFLNFVQTKYSEDLKNTLNGGFSINDKKYFIISEDNFSNLLTILHKIFLDIVIVTAQKKR